ncbi:alpha/beta fold hydrolase [Pseudonocardia abyssalis]|uniref:Alpha/beta hydrolase n=1 Tax=Pseudonocardia abyssalis TaxID=2792008 RepID=A0ABS6UTH5_9PSEU|nr:alpha/beta hydrolase [Pseudonocardia abyssalis]MBW0117973.1 alpha/beta hydrolase [Pseudonocardia abyssalis]MBW0135163.1 alpha/beta hydrolase [Pseudonocardia abyssalis]
MATIPVDGAELVFDERGTGEPLVLVHGTGAQASSWGRSVDDLAAGGYRVVAYDRRGYGRSAHPPVRDYRVHIADLAAVIEHVGAPAHVFGWSSGGNTALALAAQRPELFRSLTVLEPPWHGLRGATPDMLAALGKAKFAQARGRRRDAVAQFFRWASGLRDGANGFDRLTDAAREELYGNAATVLAELDPHPFGLMMEHVPTARLADRPFPVTWLLGGESRDWYGRLHARVESAVPGIRTERIAGVGHLAHDEDPAAFAAAVLRGVAAR